MSIFEVMITFFKQGRLITMQKYRVITDVVFMQKNLVGNKTENRKEFGCAEISHVRESD